MTLAVAFFVETAREYFTSSWSEKQWASAPWAPSSSNIVKGSTTRVTFPAVPHTDETDRDGYADDSEDKWDIEERKQAEKTRVAVPGADKPIARMPMHPAFRRGGESALPDMWRTDKERDGAAESRQYVKWVDVEADTDSWLAERYRDENDARRED